MFLKDKADLGVSEMGQLAFPEGEGIGLTKGAGPGVWALKGPQDMEQGAFPTTRWAHDSHRVSSGNIKLQVVEYAQWLPGGRVTFGQVFYLDSHGFPPG